MLDPYAWFAARRGITRETLDAWGVVVDAEGVIRFPYPGGAMKYRKGLEKDDDRKFWWDPPTQAGQVPFLPPDFATRERMILTEGESDALAVWQAIPDRLRGKVGVFGLSGLNAWKDRYVEEYLSETKRLFVTIDNDDPYENTDAFEAGNAAWEKIREPLGRRARRVKLPQGINDLAEWFMQYDWAAFEVLLKAAAEPKRNYPRLDWDKLVPDTDWLVHEMFEMGSVTVLAAPPGIGKSFLTMGLAVAVANGEEKFLGQEIRTHGPVLYVDEENNQVIVRQRIAALGLKPEHKDNLEYLSYAGVNVFTEPGRLIEDAEEMEPVLVVFDSQSAVGRGAQENSADDIAELYYRGFKPLARKTGAAVIVIHHAGLERAGPRGSSGINAAADQVITIVKTESAGITNARMNLFPSKPRRDGVTVQAEIVGSIEHDGWVRVQRPGGEEAF